MKGYQNYVAVTESDTDEFPLCQALWVGGAGTVVVPDNSGGSGTISFTCVAGTLLPIMTRKVLTASTASLIVALYP